MEKIIKAIELFDLLKGLEPDFNFSKYEQNILGEVNNYFKNTIRNTFEEINMNKVELFMELSSVDEFASIDLYIKELQSLINTLTHIITNYLPLDYLNRSGFYTSAGKLDLSSIEQVNLISTRIAEALANVDKSYNKKDMVISLPQNDIFTLLYKETLLNEQDFSFMDRGFLNSNNIDLPTDYLKAIKGKYNYFYSQNTHELILESIQSTTFVDDFLQVARYTKSYEKRPITLSIIFSVLIIIFALINVGTNDFGFSIFIAVIAILSTTILGLIFVLSRRLSTRDILSYENNFIKNDYLDIIKRNPHIQIKDRSKKLIVLIMSVPQIFTIILYLIIWKVDFLTVLLAIVVEAVLLVITLLIYRVIANEVKNLDYFYDIEEFEQTGVKIVYSQDKFNDYLRKKGFDENHPRFRYQRFYEYARAKRVQNINAAMTPYNYLFLLLGFGLSMIVAITFNQFYLVAIHLFLVYAIIIIFIIVYIIREFRGR